MDFKADWICPFLSKLAILGCCSLTYMYHILQILATLSHNVLTTNNSSLHLMISSLYKTLDVVQIWYSISAPQALIKSEIDIVNVIVSTQ